jgi:hypothetical protein
MPCLARVQRANPLFFDLEAYRPGRFACPRVHVIRFPLHRRLEPDAALRAVIGAVLDPFAIGNRRHMFVYKVPHAHIIDATRRDATRT